MNTAALSDQTGVALTSVSGLLTALVVILLVGLELGGPWPRRTLIATIIIGAAIAAVLRLIVLID